MFIFLSLPGLFTTSREIKKEKRDACLPVGRAGELHKSPPKKA